MHEWPGSDDEVTRRGLLRGAALGGIALPLLAACGGGRDSAQPGEPAGGGATSPDSGESPDTVTGTSVPTSDVPVGGGTVLADEKVVVTQPSEGEFMAFSAVCTHQGCTVQKVDDGQILCACHGSAFSVDDGSVLSGPAPRPLETLVVSVEGDEVKVG